MIGQTVYRFNENRRVYPRDDKGRSTGGPIWREHWEPQQIVGETSLSWVTDYRQKIPKRGHDPRVWALSQEDVERRVFVHENRVPISERVRLCDDPEVLAKIARLLDGEGV